MGEQGRVGLRRLRSETKDQLPFCTAAIPVQKVSAPPVWFPFLKFADPMLFLTIISKKWASYK